MPTVTVIIPVYKVERYLDACVESVVRQSYADLEILLVDDGSPDGCPALCDAWAEKDPRIKVIHRENGGLSAARNSGIDAAMGEFLLFVDSDDLLEPDAVRRAVDAQRLQDADLVIFNLTYVDEENRPLPQPDFSGFTDEILDEDGVWQRCFALAETTLWRGISSTAAACSNTCAMPRANGMRISSCCPTCWHSAKPLPAWPRPATATCSAAAASWRRGRAAPIWIGPSTCWTGAPTLPKRAMPCGPRVC